MQRAVDIAASHGKQFHVQLTGGEPCLNQDMIYESIRIIRDTAPKATIAIQTNATLLNDELVIFFKKNYVQVGVSIDGTPSVHEKTRGRFGEMFSGIQCLESHGVPWRATAVVTEESVEHLWRLVMLISRFKTARGIALDFLTLKRGALSNGIRPASPENVERSIALILDTLEIINRASNPHISFREQDTLKRCMSTAGASPFCHACNGESLAVYPDGSVYPCSQLCGEPQYCAGNVCGTIDWSNLRLADSSLKNKECFSCALNGRCPGDCPSRLAYNDENEQRAICALYKTIHTFQEKERAL